MMEKCFRFCGVFKNRRNNFFMVPTIIPSDLPREYLDAFYHFLDIKNTLNIKGTFHSPKVEDDCWLKTGTVNFYTGKIIPSHIPAGNDWKWAQSKGRKTVSLWREDITVDIFKVFPRKLTNIQCSPIPLLKMKLWIVHVKFDFMKCNTIIWCEKGLDPTPKEFDLVSSILK